MPELSAREQEIAVAAWRCLPGKEFPKIDYEALAKAADMNTVKTATNAWSAFKSKLMAAEDPTKVDLTERDLLVARVGWLCVDAGNIPKIQTNLMVEMGIFKTAKTASNTWWKVKKNLQAAASGNSAGAAASSTPDQGATPETGKRKATASARGTTDASASPKKARKARKTRGPTQTKEEAAETAQETATEERPVENPQAPMAFPACVNGAVVSPAI